MSTSMLHSSNGPPVIGQTKPRVNSSTDRIEEVTSNELAEVVETLQQNIQAPATEFASRSDSESSEELGQGNVKNTPSSFNESQSRAAETATQRGSDSSTNPRGHRYQLGRYRGTGGSRAHYSYTLRGFTTSNIDVGDVRLDNHSSIFFISEVSA